MKKSKIYNSHKKGCTESDQGSIYSYALSLTLTSANAWSCIIAKTHAVDAKLTRSYFSLFQLVTGPLLLSSPLQTSMLPAWNLTAYWVHCLHLDANMQFNIAYKIQQKASSRINKLLTPMQVFRFVIFFFFSSMKIPTLLCLVKGYEACVTDFAFKARKSFVLY